MSAAIALNRFGLGARPDETAPVDAHRWLAGQFDRFETRPVAWAALPGSRALATGYFAQQGEVRSAEDSDKMVLRRLLRTETRDTYRAAVNARAAAALATDTPFVERLVHFWANHFAISIDKLVVIPFAGAFEAEAIRPNVLGRFEDLLLAAERHPAMQFFLDQARSVGPGSPIARRVAARGTRQPGLNENLAREILELHTLGVGGGYTQADVTEFARAMTGWSLGGGQRGPLRAGEPGAFVFRAALHEPGARTIRGKRYAQEGEAQPLAVLADLAAAPATATHIATKLARHFVADTPPPALVARLAAAFTRSRGDLPTIYRALIDAPEAWAAGAPKFKTPWEWAISAMRGMGMRALGEADVAPMMNQLGQPIWRPGSPAGFDDTASAWAAPDALVRRVEVAQRFAQRLGDRVDARTLAARLLPGGVGVATRAAIARAESAPTALALLLVAPEFQRR